MPRVFLILALLTLQATACLWDRDTLAEEAKGRGDLVKIIVGWFDRYPPRYYEMRLKRVSEELAANPNDLELPKAHIEGIGGLIQLGAAWRSTDAFRSLAYSLDSADMASIAELAYLREKEIADGGPLTIHPHPDVRDQIGPTSSMRLDRSRQSDAAAYFVTARAAADSRHAMWISYQEERFAKGMHPDTHPDFWNAWSEPGFPDPPGPSAWDRVMKLAHDRIGLAASIIIVSFAIFVVIIIDFVRRRKIKAHYPSSVQ